MRRQIRRRTAVRLGTTVALTVLAAGLPGTAFPAGKDWERWSTPEEVGFSSQAIDAAKTLWQSIPDAPIAAFVLVYKGKILASFGDDTYPFWCHSMRKSFLSALYGIHVAKGNIDLDMTMEELGIDDIVPLSPAEKKAKVRHLLKARSGIYIEAACEAPEMKAVRPPRGSHPPDTFWYYNNWDFNALGTIFRQETGRDIFHEFRKRIGSKIGMQDFSPSQCEYYYEHDLSMHPCYTFRMSTRDRARFGQLFLQNGKWGKRQVVPEAWVAESTRSHSWHQETGQGYGYMWWTGDPEFFQLFLEDPRLHTLRGFYASGYGGQASMVLPDAEMVLAFGVDVYAGGDLDVFEVAPLMDLILTSREIIDLELLRSQVKPKRTVPGDPLRLKARSINRSDAPSLPTTVDFYLSPQRSLTGDARLIGTAKLKRVAPGKHKTVRLRTTLPVDLSPGTYYLVATVDGDKTNYDLDRRNNLKSSRRIIIN